MYLLTHLSVGFITCPIIASLSNHQKNCLLSLEVFPIVFIYVYMYVYACLYIYVFMCYIQDLYRFKICYTLGISCWAVSNLNILYDLWFLELASAHGQTCAPLFFYVCDCCPYRVAGNCAYKTLCQECFLLGIWYAFDFVLPLPSPSALESPRRQLSSCLQFEARLVQYCSSILVFVLWDTFLSSTLAASLLRGLCFWPSCQIHRQPSSRE